MKDIDKLCEKVNQKYNLKQGKIGSIIYHYDASENSIVQVLNQYGGVRQLIYGTDAELIKYLQNILNEKTTLNFWGIY